MDKQTHRKNQEREKMKERKKERKLQSLGNDNASSKSQSIIVSTSMSHICYFLLKTNPVFAGLIKMLQTFTCFLHLSPKWSQTVYAYKMGRSYFGTKLELVVSIH